MADTLDPLIFDLLEWCAKERRSYAEVMDAWRTSCPRLTVWEDAIDRGLLARKSTAGHGPFMEVTPRGRKFLKSRLGEKMPAVFAGRGAIRPLIPHLAC